MSSEKKPDNVVFDAEHKRYDASLKPYATNVGAPSIKIQDTTAWKNRSITKVNHKVQTKYLEIKKAYEDMLLEFEYNQLIFNAKFAFEPVIGDSYHLYRRDNGENFLSIIAPHQCHFNHVGSFRLNAESTWEKIENI